MRAGGRLYAGGGVDNKPPGIYWTYAAVVDVAGRVVIDTSTADYPSFGHYPIQRPPPWPPCCAATASRRWSTA